MGTKPYWVTSLDEKKTSWHPCLSLTPLYGRHVFKLGNFGTMRVNRKIKGANARRTIAVQDQ